MTTNIESQELRRLENADIGYEEYPTAAETDDLEAYFCICHRELTSIFTLKQFKPYWPKSVQLVMIYVHASFLSARINKHQKYHTCALVFVFWVDSTNFKICLVIQRIQLGELNPINH